MTFARSTARERSRWQTADRTEAPRRATHRRLLSFAKGIRWAVGWPFPLLQRVFQLADLSPVVGWHGLSSTPRPGDTSVVVVEIDALRRRPPGERVLVYLDQSALSSLVRNDEHADVRDALKERVEAGRVVCVRSHEHEDETLLAPRELWDEIDRLSDELAMGIQFRSREEIEWSEIYAAAAAFLGQDPPQDLSEEAFETDPHIPREELFMEVFGGAVRIRARFDPADWQIAEVEHEKSKEEPMTLVYEELRDKGFTFEDMAEANLAEMIRWNLGSLVDPARFRLALLERAAEWEATAGDQAEFTGGSPWSKVLAFATRLTQTKHLVEQYPELAKSAAEFASSDELRHMPTLAYPALFRAALAATPGRKARPGDGYDVEHLTRGLSRCDMVTADSGMTEVCRTYKLVPSGCQLFSYRELGPFRSAVETALP
jgi:hypothetical protein